MSSHKIPLTMALLMAAGVPVLANAAITTATFQVQITIQKSCSVITGAGADINFGSVAPAATNTLGSGNISVTCSKLTPYYIGLAPSVANGGGMTGNGFMSTSTGMAGNTDKVPYQLSSTAGPAGTVWGNTATASTQGNGVAGMGNGSAQVIPVFVTAPSAAFTPDSYADTVTVNVNY